MNRIWIIAVREFQKTILTKGFIFGTFVFPLVAWGAFPLVLSVTREVVPPLKGTLAIQDPTGEVVAAARMEFDPVREAEQAGKRQEAVDVMGESMSRDFEQIAGSAEAVRDLEVNHPPVDVAIEIVSPEADLKAVKQRVVDGELLAIARVDPKLLSIATEDENETDADLADSAHASEAGEPAIQIYFSNDLRYQHSRIIRDRLSEAVISARAERFGRDQETLRAIVRRPPVETIGLDEQGEETTDTTQFQQMLPIFFMILLWLSTMTAGQYTMSSTVEEKSSRVVEVVLSAVSPLQLLIGRILGQGLVSLIVLAMYGGVGIAAIIAFASLNVINPGYLVYFVLYFVIAYTMLACIMAAIGSAVNEMTEAQALVLPVMFLFLLVPMLVMVPAHQNPNGLIATLGSFIPPLTPAVMIVRIPSGEIPGWQIPVTLVLGYASVAVVFILASKIFRVGLLSRGKGPSFKQLIKWLRYS